MGVLEATGVAALPTRSWSRRWIAAPLGVDVSARLVDQHPRRARRLPARRRRRARGDGDRLVLVEDFEVEPVDTVDGGRRTGDLHAEPA